MRTTLKNSLIILGICLSSLTQAADTITSSKQGFVGGLLGFVTANNNVGSGLGYGLNGAYFLSPYPRIGVGAFIRGANHDNGVTSFFMAGEALLRLSGYLEGLHVGIILGSGKFSAGGFSGNSSIAYGIKGAYDFPISTSYPLTLGADLSLAFTSPGSSTITVFNALGSLKWWF